MPRRKTAAAAAPAGARSRRDDLQLVACVYANPPAVSLTGPVSGDIVPVLKAAIGNVLGTTKGWIEMIRQPMPHWVLRYPGEFMDPVVKTTMVILAVMDTLASKQAGRWEFMESTATTDATAFTGQDSRGGGGGGAAVHPFADDLSRSGMFTTLYFRRARDRVLPASQYSSMLTPETAGQVMSRGRTPQDEIRIMQDFLRGIEGGGLHVNCRDACGRTAMHMVSDVFPMIPVEKAREIFMFLLETGGNPLLTDDEGVRPVDIIDRHSLTPTANVVRAQIKKYVAHTRQSIAATALPLPTAELQHEDILMAGPSEVVPSVVYYISGHTNSLCCRDIQTNMSTVVYLSPHKTAGVTSFLVIPYHRYLHAGRYTDYILVSTGVLVAVDHTSVEPQTRTYDTPVRLPRRLDGAATVLGGFEWALTLAEYGQGNNSGFAEGTDDGRLFKKRKGRHVKGLPPIARGLPRIDEGGMNQTYPPVKGGVRGGGGDAFGKTHGGMAAAADPLLRKKLRPSYLDDLHQEIAELESANEAAARKQAAAPIEDPSIMFTRHMLLFPYSRPPEIPPKSDPLLEDGYSPLDRDMTVHLDSDDPIALFAFIDAIPKRYAPAAPKGMGGVDDNDDDAGGSGVAGSSLNGGGGGGANGVDARSEADYLVVLHIPPFKASRSSDPGEELAVALTAAFEDRDSVRIAKNLHLYEKKTEYAVEYPIPTGQVVGGVGVTPNLVIVTCEAGAYGLYHPLTRDLMFHKDPPIAPGVGFYGDASAGVVARGGGAARTTLPDGAWFTTDVGGSGSTGNSNSNPGGDPFSPSKQADVAHATRARAALDGGGFHEESAGVATPGLGVSPAPGDAPAASPNRGAFPIHPAHIERMKADDREGARETVPLLPPPGGWEEVSSDPCTGAIVDCDSNTMITISDELRIWRVGSAESTRANDAAAPQVARLLFRMAKGLDFITAVFHPRESVVVIVRDGVLCTYSLHTQTLTALGPVRLTQYELLRKAQYGDLTVGDKHTLICGPQMLAFSKDGTYLFRYNLQYAAVCAYEWADFEAVIDSDKIARTCTLKSLFEEVMGGGLCDVVPRNLLLSHLAGESAAARIGVAKMRDLLNRMCMAVHNGMIGPNFQNREGDTPLHVACRLQESSHPEVAAAAAAAIQWLLIRKANMFICNRERVRPYDLIAREDVGTSQYHATMKYLASQRQRYALLKQKKKLPAMTPLAEGGSASGSCEQILPSAVHDNILYYLVVDKAGGTSVVVVNTQKSFQCIAASVPAGVGRVRFTVLPYSAAMHPEKDADYLILSCGRILRVWFFVGTAAQPMVDEIDTSLRADVSGVHGACLTASAIELWAEARNGQDYTMGVIACAVTDKLTRRREMRILRLSSTLYPSNGVKTPLEFMKTAIDLAWKSFDGVIQVNRSVTPSHMTAFNRRAVGTNAPQWFLTTIFETSPTSAKQFSGPGDDGGVGGGDGGVGGGSEGGRRGWGSRRGSPALTAEGGGGGGGGGDFASGDHIGYIHYEDDAQIVQCIHLLSPRAGVNGASAGVVGVADAMSTSLVVIRCSQALEVYRFDTDMDPRAPRSAFQGYAMSAGMCNPGGGAGDSVLGASPAMTAADLASEGDAASHRLSVASQASARRRSSYNPNMRAHTAFNAREGGGTGRMGPSGASRRRIKAIEKARRDNLILEPLTEVPRGNAASETVSGAFHPIEAHLLVFIREGWLYVWNQDDQAIVTVVRLHLSQQEMKRKIREGDDGAVTLISGPQHLFFTSGGNQLVRYNAFYRCFVVYSWAELRQGMHHATRPDRRGTMALLPFSVDSEAVAALPPRRVELRGSLTRLMTKGLPLTEKRGALSTFLAAIESGVAQINFKNLEGKTALHILCDIAPAIIGGVECEQVVQQMLYLLKKGACVYLCDNDGGRPVDLLLRAFELAAARRGGQGQPHTQLALKGEEHQREHDPRPGSSASFNTDHSNAMSSAASGGGVDADEGEALTGADEVLGSELLELAIDTLRTRFGQGKKAGCIPSPAPLLTPDHIVTHVVWSATCETLSYMIVSEDTKRRPNEARASDTHPWRILAVNVLLGTTEVVATWLDFVPEAQAGTSSPRVGGATGQPTVHDYAAPPPPPPARSIVVIPYHAEIHGPRRGGAGSEGPVGCVDFLLCRDKVITVKHFESGASSDISDLLLPGVAVRQVVGEAESGATTIEERGGAVTLQDTAAGRQGVLSWTAADQVAWVWAREVTLKSAFGTGTDTSGVNDAAAAGTDAAPAPLSASSSMASFTDGPDRRESRSTTATETSPRSSTAAHAAGEVGGEAEALLGALCWVVDRPGVEGPTVAVGRGTGDSNGTDIDTDTDTAHSMMILNIPAGAIPRYGSHAKRCRGMFKNSRLREMVYPRPPTPSPHRSVRAREALLPPCMEPFTREKVSIQGVWWYGGGIFWFITDGWGVEVLTTHGEHVRSVAAPGPAASGSGYPAALRAACYPDDPGFIHAVWSDPAGAAFYSVNMADFYTAPASGLGSPRSPRAPTAEDPTGVAQAPPPAAGTHVHEVVYRLEARITPGVAGARDHIVGAFHPVLPVFMCAFDGELCFYELAKRTLTALTSVPPSDVEVAQGTLDEGAVVEPILKTQGLGHQEWLLSASGSGAVRLNLFYLSASFYDFAKIMSGFVASVQNTRLIPSNAFHMEFAFTEAHAFDGLASVRVAEKEALRKKKERFRQRARQRYSLASSAAHAAQGGTEGGDDAAAEMDMDDGYESGSSADTDNTAMELADAARERELEELTATGSDAYLEGHLAARYAEKGAAAYSSHDADNAKHTIAPWYSRSVTGRHIAVHARITKEVLRGYFGRVRARALPRTAPRLFDELQRGLDLVKKGLATPSLADATGVTPFHLVCALAVSETLPEEATRDLVKFLLRAGASINACDEVGTTPLEYLVPASLPARVVLQSIAHYELSAVVEAENRAGITPPFPAPGRELEFAAVHVLSATPTDDAVYGVDPSAVETILGRKQKPRNPLGAVVAYVVNNERVTEKEVFVIRADACRERLGAREQAQEEGKAATRIQAFQRGRQARKEVAAMKVARAAAETSQHVQEGAAYSHAAAEVIQTSYRASSREGRPPSRVGRQDPSPISPNASPLRRPRVAPDDLPEGGDAKIDQNDPTPDPRPYARGGVAVSKAEQRRAERRRQQQKELAFKEQAAAALRTRPYKQELVYASTHADLSVTRLYKDPSEARLTDVLVCSNGVLIVIVDDTMVHGAPRGDHCRTVLVKTDCKYPKFCGGYVGKEQVVLCGVTGDGMLEVTKFPTWALDSAIRGARRQSAADAEESREQQQRRFTTFGRELSGVSPEVARRRYSLPSKTVVACEYLPSGAGGAFIGVSAEAVSFRFDFDGHAPTLPEGIAIYRNAGGLDATAIDRQHLVRMKNGHIGQLFTGACGLWLYAVPPGGRRNVVPSYRIGPLDPDESAISGCFHPTNKNMFSFLKDEVLYLLNVDTFMTTTVGELKKGPIEGRVAGRLSVESLKRISFTPDGEHLLVLNIFQGLVAVYEWSAAMSVVEFHRSFPTISNTAVLLRATTIGYDVDTVYSTVAQDLQIKDKTRIPSRQTARTFTDGKIQPAPMTATDTEPSPATTAAGLLATGTEPSSAPATSSDAGMGTENAPEEATEEELTQAATKIQAVQRGRAARKEAAAKKADAAADPPSAPTDVTTAQETTATVEDPSSAPIDEATEEELTQAATKIQAVQRGRAARKEAAAKKADAAADPPSAPTDVTTAQETTATVEDPSSAPIDEATKEELTQAATKIQAVQRGRAARKEAAAKKVRVGAGCDETAETRPHGDEPGTGGEQ